MPAPYLDPDSGLEALRIDLVQLRTRLARHPLAKSLTKLVAPLVTEWMDVFIAELALGDAQIEAQVDVDLADDALDVRVDAFDDDARRVVGNDRSDPRYGLYF